MKKINIKRIIIFYLITAIIGTLSHFAYDFFNESPYLIALFPTNESVFEHMKLFFYPFIFTSLVEGFIYKENIKYFIAKRAFIISFIMLFEIVFTSIILKNIGINAFINISSYYLLMLGAYIISFYLNKESKILLYGGYINLFLWIIAFAILSYKPFNSFIFIDPSQLNIS